MKKKKNQNPCIGELSEEEIKEEAKEEITPENEGDSAALSEDEISMLKASISSAEVDRSELPPHDTSERATFFRAIKSNVALSVASAIVAVAIVLGAVGGSAFLAIKMFNELKAYTVVIGEEEPYKVDVKDAVIDDVLYIDMRRIASLAGLTLSGSSTRMQFTSAKNGTYLLFENESEYAYINGGRTEIFASTLDGKEVITAKAYVSEDQCLVPVSFLSRAISDSTMALKFDEASKTIYVRPKYFVYEGDVENRVMKDIVFTTDNFELTLPETERPTYTYSYAIDVSEYLSSIDTEYLMLVNKENPAGKYAPSNLKSLENCPTTRSNLALDYDAAVALEAMMLEMSAAGITETYVTSAYRSYERQNDLYWGYVADEKAEDPSISQEEAERRASEYSARAGESEHQTGLCVDFITSDMGGILDERFATTKAFEWLSKNAYKFGFILRYPADDVDTTGYKYEPWHYRFVGRQAASEIYFSGMCLEDYLLGQ